MNEKKGMLGKLFGTKKTNCCDGIKIVEDKEDQSCCSCGCSSAVTEKGEKKDGETNTSEKDN